MVTKNGKGMSFSQLDVLAAPIGTLDQNFSYLNLSGKRQVKD